MEFSKSRMKNVTILLFFIALTGNAFAQERRIDEKKIPQTVISHDFIRLTGPLRG